MGNGAKNGWWIFRKFFLIFPCKSEEEIGSAGVHPISNRIYHEE